MPYDWAAYRKSHPHVAPRVERLAKARRAAQQPTQIITEAAKQEAIKAGKVVLEKKSGEVIITTPETGAVKRFAAAVPWKRELVVAPPPRVEPARPAPPPPSRPYLRREPALAPPKPAPIMEPPVMRKDIRITPTGEFVMFEREPEPKAIIGLEKVYEKPEPGLFEFLVPKRTEREIAYGLTGLEIGFRPVIEFIPGVAHGILMIPETILKLPETTLAFVTDPLKSITASYERFLKMPGFVTGEIVGQTLATYGISKLVGVGLAKYRAKSVTAATEVGVYEFAPAKGLGKLGVDIVIKKAGKVIETAKVQVGFKVGKKLFDPSVYAAEVVAEKTGLAYVLGKGVVLSKVTAPSGISITMAKAAGIVFKYPGFEKTLATMGISKTLAGPKGLLRTLGLSVSKKGRIITGQKAYSMLFRKPVSGFKITKIVTKPGVKPSVVLPAVVGAEVKTIADLIGKATVKPGPAITRAGVLTGAVTAFVGMEETAKAVTGIPGKLDVVMDISPWARIKKPIIEEDVYISSRARGVVGVQALDTRQRVLSMQRLGLGAGQAQRTLSDLGISRAVRPKERLGISLKMPSAFREISRVGIREKPAVRLKPAVISRAVMRERISMPGILMPSISVPRGIPFVVLPELKKKVPRKRKPRVKPRYKYRVIKHPFPSLKKLMGI